jgi:hypothetical protein
MSNTVNRIPGFTAENALHENRGYYRAIVGVYAMLRTSDSAQPFGLHNDSFVFPAFGLPSCAILCSRCEEAGGICIHLGNGRCLCA